MAGNRITSMLILKMAIADLLVTISVMPFSVLFWVGEGGEGEVNRRTFWRNFLQNRSLFISNVHTSFDCYCHVSFDWSLFRCNVPNEAMSITKHQNDMFLSYRFVRFHTIPFMISFGIKERDGIYDCLRCFLSLNSNSSLQISYLVTFNFLYYAPLLIPMVLYTFISRTLWKQKITGNVTEERDKSSEEEKRRVIIALISTAAVFGAHACYAVYDKFSKYGCLA